MAQTGRTKLLAVAWAILGIGLSSLGCQSLGGHGALTGESRGQMADGPGAIPPHAAPACGPHCGEGPGDGPGSDGAPLPTELCKISLPPYRIETPDILAIDALRLMPLPPYRIEAQDVLIITATPTLANQPIAGTFPVTPDGRVILGFGYGSVPVAGLTLEEAEAIIREHLTRILEKPQVSVALGQIRPFQQIRGEHMVGPDGTISLGTYGDVYVAGMTRWEARCAIERHLSRCLLNPEISLSVYAYNSKVYYIILDGGGYGQQVYRFPATGNETVLDAISNISGLPAVASTKRIWVARPAPPYHKCDQVLPVDWRAVVEGGSTQTNYQIFPGDRIYVKADRLIAFDNALAKIISPIERLLGVTLLGSETVNSLRSGSNAGTLVVPVR